MAIAPKQWICQCVIAIVLYLLLGIFSLLANAKTIKSFKRGFFCDDQSLWHPFREDTVKESVVMAIVVILPLILVCLVELASWLLYNRSSNNSDNFDEFVRMEGGETYFWNNQRKLHPIVVNMTIFCAIYYFGLVLNQTLTDIGKLSIGRLRPHFFKVCNPVDDKKQPICPTAASTNFITDYACKGGDGITDYMLYNVHLSFPSGHSSHAAYCAVFLVLYLHYRLRGFARLPLLRIFVQSLLLGAAFYCGLSRISDYKHHWSDVLSGFALGALCAVIASIQNERLRPFSKVIAHRVEESLNSENHLNRTS